MSDVITVDAPDNVASLVRWDRLKHDVEQAHSIDELREIRDKAEALRQYSKRHKESLDIQNKMAEITLRCSRRMGEMLLDMPKNPGGKAEQELYRSHDATSKIEKLEDIGITKSDSSRWQAIASIPEETFEKHIEEVKASHKELTTSGLVQVAQRQQKEEAREQRRDDNRQEIAKAQTIEEALGSARFATIVIDPPWDWGDEGDVDQLGRAKPVYGTMPIGELLALPVGSYADESCHLYLWITNRSLPKGFQLIEKWGFRYVTCVTWVKPSYGMGNYFRGQTEHLLFGVKGSQPLKRKDVGTVFNAPRGPHGHSSKPIAVYPLIESCSPGPYLEIFARSERPDWTSWGAEV
jgi:N6-adenosine-specific RNA methylase IME4